MSSSAFPLSRTAGSEDKTSLGFLGFDLKNQPKILNKRKRAELGSLHSLLGPREDPLSTCCGTTRGSVTATCTPYLLTANPFKKPRRFPYRSQVSLPPERTASQSLPVTADTGPLGESRNGFLPRRTPSGEEITKWSPTPDQLANKVATVPSCLVNCMVTDTGGHQQQKTAADFKLSVQSDIATAAKNPIWSRTLAVSSRDDDEQNNHGSDTNMDGKQGLFSGKGRKGDSSEISDGLVRGATVATNDMETSQHTDSGCSFKDPFEDEGGEIASTSRSEDTILRDFLRGINDERDDNFFVPPTSLSSATASTENSSSTVSQQFPMPMPMSKNASEGNRSLSQYNAWLQLQIQEIEGSLKDNNDTKAIERPSDSLAQAGQQQYEARHAHRYDDMNRNRSKIRALQQPSPFLFGGELNTSNRGLALSSTADNQQALTYFPGVLSNPFFASQLGTSSYGGAPSEPSQRRTEAAAASSPSSRVQNTASTAASSLPLQSESDPIIQSITQSRHKVSYFDDTHRATPTGMAQRQPSLLDFVASAAPVMHAGHHDDDHLSPWNPIPIGGATNDTGSNQDQRMVPSPQSETGPGFLFSRTPGKVQMHQPARVAGGQDYVAPAFPADIQLPQRPRLPPCEDAGKDGLPSSSVTPYHQRTDSIVPLAIDEDPNWLTEFLCFVRSDMVEVVRATEFDVETRMATTKHITRGQVGIRCRFCSHLPQRANRSSCFPSTIRGIYQSVTMMIREHFSRPDGSSSCGCPAMPPAIQQKYLQLKSRTTQGATDSKRYWVEAAKKMGMVDTNGRGITMSATTIDEAVRSEHLRIQKYWRDTLKPLKPFSLSDSEDRKLLQKLSSSDYVFFLLSQVEMITLTEEECLGNRRNMQPGWPGFGCRCCCALARMGTCRFFPVKRRALVTKLMVDLPNHLKKCTACPQSVKDELTRHRSQLEENSPKELDLSELDKEDGDPQEFFDRIWNRLHSTRQNKRKAHH